MYKAYTAADYRQHLKLPADYKVDGFLIYGTFRKFPYQQLEESLKRQGCKYKLTKPEDDEYFEPVVAFEVNGKNCWFTIAYGGAMLSEYLHLACMFGSKKNILLGSCGGLKKGASSLDIIIPDWSYGDESSARSYQPDKGGRHSADPSASKRLATKLSKYTVHTGSTVTHQAMTGETWEDVLNWSRQGYIGVEMEASTVFAVSNHFKVPSAAILRIGDNLIEQETVMDINYENLRDLHRQVSQDMVDAAVEELLNAN